jgi:hypothetical protein
MYQALPLCPLAIADATALQEHIHLQMRCPPQRSPNPQLQHIHSPVHLRTPAAERGRTAFTAGCGRTGDVGELEQMAKGGLGVDPEA